MLAADAEDAEEDLDVEADVDADVTIAPVTFELPEVVCDETVVTVTDDCVLVADIDGSAIETACEREVDGPGTGQAVGRG